MTKTDEVKLQSTAKTTEFTKTRNAQGPIKEDTSNQAKDVLLSRETLEEHFFLMYRDNTTYQQIMPTIIRILEKSRNNVDTKVFPVGTEQDEIEKWIKENYENMDNAKIYSDWTCRRKIISNIARKFDKNHLGQLTSIERKYKEETNKLAFTHTLKNPTVELAQFELLCDTVFKNNPDTIPQKVYYNLPELLPTILQTNADDSNALDVIKSYVNDEEKEIIQRIYEVAKKPKDAQYLCVKPREIEITLCLIIRTLHRILEKAASNAKKEDVKIDYEIIHGTPCLGRSGELLYDVNETITEFILIKNWYLDGNPKINVGDWGKQKSWDTYYTTVLDKDIDNPNNWFIGHHHPVNHLDNTFDKIKRIKLDDIINAATETFPNETSSLFILTETQKNGIIKSIVEEVFEWK